MPNTYTVYACWSGCWPNKEKLQMEKDLADDEPIPVHKFPVAHVKVCYKWKQLSSSFMVTSEFTNFAKVCVCKLHFNDGDYESDKTQDGVRRRRNRLKADGVLSVFPVAPSYMEKVEKWETHMTVPSARLDSPRDEALVEEKQMLKDICVGTLDELAAKMKNHRGLAGLKQAMY